MWPIPSDLGNTCIAVLALMRAGNTPKEGQYAKNVARGRRFHPGPGREGRQGIALPHRRPQHPACRVKIGPYVDTFLAQLVMSELKGKMQDDKSEKRLLAAFDKTITKIAKHQKVDGNFKGNEAWASTLSMALCSKGINRAAQMGFTVPQPVLASGPDGQHGRPGRCQGDVHRSRRSSRRRDRGGTDGPQRCRSADLQPGRQDLGSAGGRQHPQEGREEEPGDSSRARPLPRKRRSAPRPNWTRLKDAEKVQTAAVDGLIRRLDDKQFIQGFGSNGGEEFLSYMNISETAGGPRRQGVGGLGQGHLLIP